MIDSLTGSRLSDFAHRGLTVKRDPAGRIMAAAATALFYAVLLFLTVQGFEKVQPPRGDRAPIETVRLLPPVPHPRLALQDFTVHLIRPHAENAPMPQFVIAPDASNAPRATLASTAARDTPMTGGAMGGNAAGAVSGVGTGGSGHGMSACMDPAYLEQIMRHVSRWYLYPDLGRAASGIAYVHFVIDRTGHYKSLTLVRGTGNDWLDGAAMRTMRQAEPLPPIPDRFHTDRLDGVMPMIYQRGGQKLLPEQLGAMPGGC
jgi:TonB family protein